MIWFVGAGPGAEDLITVRGMRLLAEADVIIYAGSLVNPALLSYARRDAGIYDSARMTLEEILTVMEQADAEGKNLVRLHTGEPSLYGAVREQMDALDKKGIRYASCPGVSACFGAAAELNLEYTVPERTQTLIITRLSGRTGVPETESIASLAAHHTSMAIYLSSGMLDQLSAKLQKGGLSPDTPAVLFYKATWPDGQCFSCTVGTLQQTGEEHHITKTAVVLVGDVLGCPAHTRSKLYDPSFSTQFREAKAIPADPGTASGSRPGTESERGAS